jgi:metal-responsive CopG/Arc/MetJ family transcriptional regulator
MDVNTINISFKKDLLKMIDKIAQEEARSRSELIREAARMYIERKKRWEQIFAFGDQQEEKTNISENDLEKEIHEYRRSKRNAN